MNTAAYIRRSKKEQRANSHSIDMQLKTCQTVSTKLEWDSPKPYVDKGISGDEFLRKGLIEMLLDIHRKKIKRVACYALDRLARDDLIRASLMHFFGEHSVKIYFDDIGQTTEPELLIPIIGAIAQKEQKSIKRRTKSGMERAAAKGALIGHPPAGFTVNKTKTKWILSKRGKTIKRFIEGDRSIESISKEMGLSIRTVRRVATRLKAWKEGGLEALLKEATAKARVRAARAEARREEDRKILRKFLIDPNSYERQVRERLAAMEERKRKYGHRKGD